MTQGEDVTLLDKPVGIIECHGPSLVLYSTKHATEFFRSLLDQDQRLLRVSPLFRDDF